MTVVGTNIVDPTLRRQAWLSLLESKKSYNHFKNSADEQEQEIADLDKKVYDFFMNKYLGDIQAEGRAA